MVVCGLRPKYRVDGFGSGCDGTASYCHGCLIRQSRFPLVVPTSLTQTHDRPYLLLLSPA